MQHPLYFKQPQMKDSGQNTPEASQARILARAHTERLLDDALADTFPCSDPVSTLFSDDPQQNRRGHI